MCFLESPTVKVGSVELNVLVDEVVDEEVTVVVVFAPPHGEVRVPVFVQGLDQRRRHQLVFKLIA